MPSITLINASVDKTPGGQEIIRGSLIPRELGMLKVDEYQREVLGEAVHTKLIKGIIEGSVPDIELGLRTKRYTEKGREITLLGDAYIIDGLQRVSAAKLMLERGESGVPYIGATVFVNTTPEWERERFRILNSDRTKLSPNVLLRNLRHESTTAGILWELTDGNPNGFVLDNRVNWQQKARVTDMLQALLFAKVVGFVHSHFGAGRSSKVDDLMRGLDAIVDEIGRETFIGNIKYFFSLVDECFQIGQIKTRKRAPAQLTGSFLMTLARLLDEHENFWKDNELFVPAALRRKLAKFPITDPNIASICSSGGRANDFLFLMMIEHLNSGKRTKHLTRRTEEYPALRTMPLPGVGDDEEEDES